MKNITNPHSNHRDIFAEVKPDMSFPDNKALAESVKRLMEALRQNTGANLHAGISPSDAENIIQYVVAFVRKNLSEHPISMRDIDFSAGQSFKDASLQETCGLAAHMAHHVLKNTKLFPLLIQMSSAVKMDKKAHVLSIVSLPISENGRIQNKDYLIDITFKQFCTEKGQDTSMPAYVATLEEMPGYRLSQTHEGTLFAKTLLARGYMELTPQNARLYLDGFNDGAALPPNCDAVKIIKAAATDPSFAMSSHLQKRYDLNPLRSSDTPESFLQ